MIRELKVALQILHLETINDCVDSSIDDDENKNYDVMESIKYATAKNLSHLLDEYSNGNLDKDGVSSLILESASYSC